MSDCRAIDVANAMVALLNSDAAQATFAPFQFTAKRDYRPTFDLRDHKQNLTVTVVPATVEHTPFSRANVQDLVAIDVGIQNFIDAENLIPECDAMMALVEQIKEALEAPAAIVLADPPADCGWQATENDPIFSPEHLQQHSVFTSVPRFMYLTRRTR